MRCWPLALMLAACQPMTGFELRIIASPDLELPAEGVLNVRDEVRLGSEEVNAPFASSATVDFSCLSTPEGCRPATRGSWDDVPEGASFVVRAWIDVAGDDVYDASAEPPMLEYLPDAEDPQGVALIPLRVGEIADAVLEIGPVQEALAPM